VKPVENIRIAVHSIRGYLLRTVLTALIIGFGIMALVGILTTIDAVKYYCNNNFAMMGSNSFTIRNTGLGIHVNSDGKKRKRFKSITFEEAERFRDEFRYPATVSVSAFATHLGVLRYKSNKSNPNVSVMGGDDNYLLNTGYVLDRGRNFSSHDLENGSNVAIIGSEIAETIFRKEDPLDKSFRVGGDKYRVIGILAEKGSSMGFSSDKIVMLPLRNVKYRFLGGQASYSITVRVSDVALVEPALAEASGLFRKIRGDRVGEEDSFEVTKSDSLAAIVIHQLGFIAWAASIIAFITLLGSGVGLMNIMLVSVTERTREIGIRKSMGATNQAIRRQFLTEAVVVCQLGGILGILFGIGAGNLMSLLMHVGFIVPWLWILLAIGACFLTGILSGYYPARKAARLDPVDALRYE